MTFNSEEFLAGTLEVVNEEKFTPVPEGEYQAVITDLEIGPSKSGDLRLDVTWTILDQDKLAEELGLEELTVRQGIFISVEDDGKTIKTGTNQNYQLGRFRAKFGLNKKGINWQDFIGKQATISVVHAAAANDPTVTYSNVGNVTVS